MEIKKNTDDNFDEYSSNKIIRKIGEYSLN